MARNKRYKGDLTQKIDTRVTWEFYQFLETMSQETGMNLSDCMRSLAETGRRIILKELENIKGDWGKLTFQILKND